MTPILTIENLRVEIPVKAGLLKAVRGVDLAIDPGETHGLVGESGSGKSLTALAVMGLLPRKARRSAKTLHFADIDLMALRGREMEDIRGDRVAMVFQDPMTSLNPTFTVGAQLVETLRRHRQVTRAEASIGRSRCSSAWGSRAPTCGCGNIRTSSPGACANA